MRIRIRFLLLLLLPLLALGLAAAAGAGEPEPVPVTARLAADLLFFPERSAPAEVVPLNDADLSAEINARIDAIRVRVGEEVRTGDLLVQLDCRDNRSRLEAQQATRRALETRRRLAVAQLERARNLKRERNISEEEVDRRETDLLALDAEIAAQKEAEDQAALNVGRCEVRAPFPAVVSARLAGVGTLAAPGTPLVHLVQTDDLEVSARLRPEEAREGAEAQTLEFSWLGDRYPLGFLRRVPAVDPRTRTVEVRLGFTGNSAPPGASGRVYWRSPRPHLPADLLIRRDGRLGVFLSNEGHARFLPLPGALEGQPAAVDLPAGARVVVAGRYGLEDGQPLTVTDQDGR